MRLQHLPQTHTVHQLHQEVIKLARLAQVIHVHNVRVVQPGQSARLARKPFREGGIAGEFGRQYLQCDHPVEPALARPIDCPHAAGTQKTEDVELRKKAAQRFRGRRGKAAGHVRGQRFGHQDCRCLEAFRTERLWPLRRQLRPAPSADS